MSGVHKPTALEMGSATVVAPKAPVGSTQLQSEKAVEQKVRKYTRPNYNQIHRNLLPVEVHPLPTLILHNPVSILAVALSYITRLIASPQRTIYNGYFSSTTSSIHITDNEAIRALWEMGFFGRGSLSRSEPTWCESQKKKGLTAEENTGQRRTERRQQKLERAKKEQEDIALQLSKEQEKPFSLSLRTKDLSTASLMNTVLKTNDSDMSDIASVLNSGKDKTGNVHQTSEDNMHGVETNGIPTPPPSTHSENELDRPVKRLQRSKTVRFSPTIEAREFELSSPVISPLKSPGLSVSPEVTDPVPSQTPPASNLSIASTPPSTPETENKEHLNLSLEEAFFLSYGLGVLNIYCEDSDTIFSSSSLLSLFRRHSYHPTRSLSIPQEPDDPFLLSYVVYHHYRSLGWVVRSGVKFSTDYLLYNRGPAFAHAEFAVVILPAYSHPYWSETSARIKSTSAKTTKSWDWLHGINRVQAQVHKSLLLCYVEIPPPLTKAEKGKEVDIGKELSRYTVRDVSVKRWTPNRTRD